MIYYVFGVRHEVFVEANSPEEALIFSKEVVQEWEYPAVKLAVWKDKILTVEGETLLESKE